ncbi:uncharacterized protein ANIA_11321 [Aspergillus nidulans FGSC A4]|uniref:Uncharacterized protein n=1 Tax=Emericella nidulans (strain FGSC A4 / ATCC 38163 / CBS 112.46 / NRRL 194 / M139) TaxID=227321 RepID=C8VLC3_EMENI|nr:hypothetical protein [Aspergillus nidulans FGSC A4]CBF85979.1 TPA: hypothetical protein ANIA_11321 [Aspergillus nidulans FGSC A4]
MVTRRDPVVTTSAWALLYVTAWHEVPTTSLAYRYTSMPGTIGDPLKQDDGGKSQQCRFPSTPPRYTDTAGVDPAMRMMMIIISSLTA